MIFNKNNKGMSLVEMMITAFLFSIILGAIMITLSTGRASLSTGSSQVDVQQDARKALNAMVRELRQAGMTTILGVPADGSINSSITFQIPSSISVAGPVWSGAIQYSLGGLNNRQLLRVQSGNTRVMGNNISNISFSRNAGSPETLNISVSVQKNTFPGFVARQSTAALSSRVRLRN